jgi:hypothetical protein
MYASSPWTHAFQMVDRGPWRLPTAKRASDLKRALVLRPNECRENSIVPYAYHGRSVVSRLSWIKQS